MTATDDPLFAFLRCLTPAQIFALSRALFPHEPLITSREAAKYLGVSVRQLAHWRHKNIGPAWVELPGDERALYHYRQSTLNAFALIRQTQTDRMPSLATAPITTLRQAFGRFLPRTGLSGDGMPSPPVRNLPAGMLASPTDRITPKGRGRRWENPDKALTPLPKHPHGRGKPRKGSPPPPGV